MNFPSPQELVRSFVNAIVHRAAWQLPRNWFIVLLVLIIILSFVLNK
jgi:hypothetical protein